MSYGWLILVVTVSMIAHYAVVSRLQGVLTLDGIFVPSQWIMAVGTLVLLDSQDPRDSLYSIVVTLPMLIYILVSIVVHFVLRKDWSGSVSEGARKVVFAVRLTPATGALLLSSIAIVVLYFRAVGYNVFLIGVSSFGTGVSHDYTTLRLESYASSRYLYPGYVNQFKNCILPALTVVVVHYLFHARRRHRKLISVALIITSVVSLLGTGQRGAFILFVLTTITFLYHMDRKLLPKRALIALVTVGPLLVLSTSILGRDASQVASATGPFDKVGILVSEIGQRFFHVNQMSGQAGFHFTYGQPTQNGADWLRSVLGILPNSSGSTLPSQIFKSLYGTDRGTAPPSMWGSVFYNFGWVGIIVLPIILAVLYQSVTVWCIDRQSMSSLELIGMSGTFVVCGNWIAGGPEYLLNAGGVTFAVLWWMGRRVQRLGGLTPDNSLLGTLPGSGAGARRGSERDRSPTAWRFGHAVRSEPRPIDHWDHGNAT